ncbi:trichodiene oxygenase-2 [Coleophoma cylindrospora]|uniref:Trichodiene oxygenase-2 n=1 Tax=Coleophoma cylindrospora TaxID=1849047 RepID=A0A3D8RMU1_9HELO|nr:trichodiene oxygenase-2 [Coleophoma cylindrospora]
MAAASHLYEAYYNLIAGGYFRKFIPMHDKYNSPVVRIGTNHVHVGDPKYYHTIYNSGTDFAKAHTFYGKLGTEGAILTISDPEEHKKYRSIVSPLFSRKSSDDLGPTMAAELDKATLSMARQGKEGKVTVIQQVYRALSADMVCHLLFGRSLGLLDTPGTEADHYHPLMRSVDKFTGITWLRIYYSVVNWVISSFPDFVVNWLQPGMLSYEKIFNGWLEEAIATHDSGKESEGKETFFDLIVKSRRKTGDVLSSTLIFNDVFNYIVAGMESSSYVLSFATYFILTNPDAKAKLEKELLEARPFIRNLDHRKLMTLPYLTAVVKESLRLSNTVPGSLPRIVPKGIDIGGFHIAGGTIISMAHPIVERDENIFPEPDAFIPERWMGSEAQKLEKWSIAFSRGRRQCIATNLAYLELYTTIAVFFSRFEMELFDTTASDMELIDVFAPITKNPVKVKILHDRWANSDD